MLLYTAQILFTFDTLGPEEGVQYSKGFRNHSKEWMLSLANKHSFDNLKRVPSMNRVSFVKGTILYFLLRLKESQIINAPSEYVPFVVIRYVYC